MFLITAIKSENMGKHGYFSGAEGLGNNFLPLSTKKVVCKNPGSILPVNLVCKSGRLSFTVSLSINDQGKESMIMI